MDILNLQDHWNTNAALSEERCTACGRIEYIPTDRKYTIGIDEAARYYGIGSKKLRQIISDNPMGDFYLEIGRHVLIKRRQFEQYLDQASSL